MVALALYRRWKIALPKDVKPVEQWAWLSENEFDDNEGQGPVFDEVAFATDQDQAETQTAVFSLYPGDAPTFCDAEGLALAQEWPSWGRDEDSFDLNGGEDR